MTDNTCGDDGLPCGDPGCDFCGGAPELLDRAASAYAAAVERMAVAIHEDCLLEWQAIRVVDPDREVTQHGPDAHYGQAHDLVRRYGLPGAKWEDR